VLGIVGWMTVTVEDDELAKIERRHSL